MSPEKPVEQSTQAVQGSLFVEHAVSNGAPDPLLFQKSIELEPVEGGVYDQPESSTPALEFADESILASVQEAVKRDNRRKAQSGKHSPLLRDGSYLGVRPGDVLPQFGIVKKSNLAAAQQHAARLESERTAQ